MNMKILSLSLVLIIANSVYGMNSQDKAFYTEELRKAKNDFNDATQAKQKIYLQFEERTGKELRQMHETIDKIMSQRHKENNNCQKLGLDCKATECALKDISKVLLYLEGEYSLLYKEKVSPAFDDEISFHKMKVKKLESLLSGSNLEEMIKDMEPSYNKDDEYTKWKILYDRIAQYLRSLLPEKRIESTMQQYQ